MSASFYRIFIGLQKTTKNIFYFIEKSLFVLEIFTFLYFFPFLSTLSRFKRTCGIGIISDVISLHKFADVIFGITQKLL